MKVSVVIPAYNEEKTISPSIEAILAQDYTDFEIIVVNNALARWNRNHLPHREKLSS